MNTTFTSSLYEQDGKLIKIMSTSEHMPEAHQLDMCKSQADTFIIPTNFRISQISQRQLAITVTSAILCASQALYNKAGLL
jgi:hypothetical protein